MNEVELWFKEAQSNGVVKVTDSNFIIFKGFKITREGNIYNVRNSDYYKKASNSDIATFRKHGFVKGAILIVHRRNIKRVEKFENILSRLYTDKYTIDRANAKKYGLCIRDIEEMTYLLFLYRTRIEQTKNFLKYGIRRCE